MTRTAILLLVLSLASIALAEPADTCAESFPARLADAKQAVAHYMDFMQDYEKAKPALEWFEAHCRLLDELEIAVRKIDDPNAFVCDPKAKGRPKNLTSQLVLTYSVLPDVGSFQADRYHGPNNQCSEADRAARIDLVFGGATELAQVAQRLLVTCYGDDRPACVKARENFAAYRASGKL